MFGSMMLARCSSNLKYTCLVVSPAYCFLHLLQVRMYLQKESLHVIVSLMVTISPEWCILTCWMMVLPSEAAPLNGQRLHLLPPVQHLNPTTAALVTCCFGGRGTLAWISYSAKFGPLLRHAIGGAGNGCFSL